MGPETTTETNCDPSNALSPTQISWSEVTKVIDESQNEIHPEKLWLSRQGGSGALRKRGSGIRMDGVKGSREQVRWIHQPGWRIKLFVCEAETELLKNSFCGGVLWMVAGMQSFR